MGRISSAVLFLAFTTISELAAAQVTEIEPNDGATTATMVPLSRNVSGTIEFGDKDYFAVDVKGGTKLQLVIVEHQFCAGFTLWDRDGKSWLASTDCLNENLKHDTLSYAIPVDGRYYFSIFHVDETPGDGNHPSLPYTIKVAPYQPPAGGLGNPMHVFASGLDGVNAWIATPSGDIIAAQYPVNHNQLVRITPEGRVTTFASEVPWMTTPSAPGTVAQLAVDAFGDLLVPAGGVWRYDLRTGERTEFTGHGDTEYGYWGIAIGADGDVWLSQFGSPSTGSVLSRFDALGHLKEKVTVPGLGSLSMTMSQAGEIWFVGGNPTNVYRLVGNRSPQRVIDGRDEWHPFSTAALDRDGWIYLIQPYQQRMVVYNPQYQLVHDPLAQINDSAGWVNRYISSAGALWMRDHDGNMTSRMLVGMYDGPENTGPMKVLEMNPHGMGSPGADPMLHVVHAELRKGSVGSPYGDTLRLQQGSSSSWSVVAGELPRGVSLSSAGVLTGTPTEQGTAKFSVRATDGGRAGFGRFTIVVEAAVALSLDQTALRSGTVGVSYADTLRVTNAEGPVSWSVSAGKLPPGIALGQSTGVLSGTPTDTGSFTFTANAASGARNGSQQFTIAIAKQGTVTVAVADIVAALLGGPGLSAEQVTFLDGHGNHNGVLDVGDLRAYLRAQGQLAPRPQP